MSKFLAAVRWFIMHRVFPAAIILAVGVGIGAFYFATSSVSYAEHTVVKEVKVAADAPVLDRIAACESHGKQFLESGTIVTNTNTNGTVDVGRYQINMSAEHIREMAKLGFNPLTDEGNTAYAKYLYANRGTGDWQSSSACWKR